MGDAEPALAAPMWRAALALMVSSIFAREYAARTILFFFFILIRPPPRSTLFPSTTLSRSVDPAGGVAGSTLVTVMARNGTDFGIRVSGCGERWFTAPVNMPQGLYFPGFGPDDANPDMGDSAIVETIGLGAFAMVAAPAVARFLGAGGTAEAAAVTAGVPGIRPRREPALR